MKKILIICLFFVSVYSDSKDTTTKNETYNFSVAMVKQTEDGQNKLCTSSKPTKGYNYFVTNKAGEVIGKVDSFEKDSMETCEGYMTVWNLNFNNIRSSDIINESYQYLIIKTKTDLNLDFKCLYTKLCQIPVNILLKLTGMQQIKSSSSKISIYYLGTINGNERYGVTLLNGNISDCKLLIIELNSNEPTIVFDKTFESGKGAEKIEITNMTDIDNDGFADTFIVDLGDYGGIYIIENNNGQWKTTTATPYDPC